MTTKWRLHNVATHCRFVSGYLQRDDFPRRERSASPTSAFEEQRLRLGHQTRWLVVLLAGARIQNGNYGLAANTLLSCTIRSARFSMTLAGQPVPATINPRQKLSK